MISRNQDGEVVFTADETSELVGALKEIFNSTAIGQTYKQEYYVKARGDEDAAKILGAAIQIAGGPNISTRHLTHALTLLLDSGEIQPRVVTQAAQLEEPAIDNRPKGRDGKPLTDSQIKWQEYRVWSETCSSDERKRRMGSDPDYASFVRKSLRAEMDQPIDGVGTILGQPTTKTRASQELVTFAQQFLVEPSSNLRPKNGMVSLGGKLIPWPTFQELLNKATAAGVI